MMATGTLYVVATPIGNLSDLTVRAQACLGRVASIYCEDTRQTRKLLAHLGLHVRLQSLHEHNELARSEEVKEALSRGEDVALVSDAGTPCLSDPGARLVARVVEAGYTAVPVPGPSAVSAALSIAGFNLADGYAFAGFLPARGRLRHEALARLVRHAVPAVLFEAPHRLRQLADDLETLCPDRAICVCREMTKMHEEIVRGRVVDVLPSFQDPRGEFTLVLGPAGSAAAATLSTDMQPIDEALERCAEAGLTRRDAVAAVAAVLRIPRRRVYERAHHISRFTPPGTC